MDNNKDSTNALYGWDLLFRTVEKDVRNSADIIVAVVHWLLTKHSFRCLGIGDDVSHPVSYIFVVLWLTLYSHLENFNRCMQC